MWNYFSRYSCYEKKTKHPYAECVCMQMHILYCSAEKKNKKKTCITDPCLHRATSKIENKKKSHHNKVLWCICSQGSCARFGGEKRQKNNRGEGKEKQRKSTHYSATAFFGETQDQGGGGGGREAGFESECLKGRESHCIFTAAAVS